MTLKVDPALHNPAPDYLKALLAKAGISIRLSARLLAVNPRSMRNYLSGRDPIPYSVQFALEYLAENPPRREDYNWPKDQGAAQQEWS